MIPYSRQKITNSDIEQVKKVLKSDFLTQGPVVPKFERNIADYVKSKYAVAVNSATSALHISCLSLDIKKGDIVWTSTNTFVASANCALYCGAKIDLVDININDWNISIENLEEKLVRAKKNKKIPKVLITVHFAGQPTYQEAIWKLSIKYGFKIIEDASHSLGAQRNKIKVGSCKWSHITVFSLHPVKIITSGEGGMATTNDKKLFSKLMLFRNHGIERNTKNMLSKNKFEGDWYFEQQFLGYNYRMTDILAALGNNQLKSVDKFVKKRNLIANLYCKKLSGLPLKIQRINDDNLSSYHLFPIVIDLKERKKCRKTLFQLLRKNNILVNVHYIPVYRHPFYQKNYNFNKKDFPNTEKFYAGALSLPIFYDLNQMSINYICDLVSKSIKSYID